MWSMRVYYFGGPGKAVDSSCELIERLIVNDKRLVYASSKTIFWVVPMIHNILSLKDEALCCVVPNIDSILLIRSSCFL